MKKLRLFEMFAGYGGTMNIPLTDNLLLDIVSLGIKRLNKLKTAMEALK